MAQCNKFKLNKIEPGEYVQSVINLHKAICCNSAKELTCEGVWKWNPWSPAWLVLHHPWQCLFPNWEKIISVRQGLNKFGGQGGSFMVSRSVHTGNNQIWRGEWAPSLKLFSLWRGKGRIVNICLWSKEKSLNLLLSCKLQLFVECDWCPVECKISEAERPWGYH